MGPCAPRPPLQRCGSYGPASRPSCYPCRRSSGWRAEPGLVFACYADHLLACVDPARQLWWLVLRGHDLRVRRDRPTPSSRLSFFCHFFVKGGHHALFRLLCWGCSRAPAAEACEPDVPGHKNSCPVDAEGPADPRVERLGRRKHFFVVAPTRSGEAHLTLSFAGAVGSRIRRRTRAPRRLPVPCRGVLGNKAPPFPNSVECFPVLYCALFISSPVAMRAVSGGPFC